MYKLIGQVLEVEVDQPSRVSIKNGEILVIPLNLSKVVPIKQMVMDFEEGSPLDRELGDIAPKRLGRQKDPNSTLFKVRSLCEKLHKEGMSEQDIRARVKEDLHDQKSVKTLDQYFYVWRAGMRQTSLVNS